MSAGDYNNNTLAYYVQYRAQKPGVCSGCGRCNTCGRPDWPSQTTPWWGVQPNQYMTNTTGPDVVS